MIDYESIEVRLFRLQDEHYVEHAVARDGGVLASDAPFAITATPRRYSTSSRSDQVSAASR
jgi:hypothetical protein